MDRFFSRALLPVALAVSLSVALPAATHGQISADRPGFGDGTATVAPGTFQAGLGYAFNGNGGDRHELGQLLLRYGVGDRLEVRGGVGSFEVTEGENGYSGTTLGAKVRLFQSGPTAASGVATLGLPTGTGRFNSPDDRARQEVKLAVDQALGDGLTLSINGGTSFYYASGTQADRDVNGLFIPTLSFGVTEQAGAYVGYAGFYDDGANENWAEGGITVLANPDTQLDVNGGLRVDEGDGYFVGLGVARRF